MSPKRGDRAAVPPTGGGRIWYLIDESNRTV